MLNSGGQALDETGDAMTDLSVATKSMGIDLGTLNLLPHVVIIAEPHRASDGSVKTIDICWANSALSDMCSPDNLLGRCVTQFEMDETCRNWLEGSMAKDNLHELQERTTTTLRIDGIEKTFQALVFWLRGYLILMAHETQPESSPSLIIKAMDSISKLMASTPIAFSVANEDFWLNHGTESFCENFGYAPEAFHTLSIFEKISEDDKTSFVSCLETAKAGEAASTTVALKRFDGGTRTVEVWASRLNEVSAAKAELFLIIRDLDAQLTTMHSPRSSSLQMQSEVNWLSKALNVSRDGFAIWDARTAPNGSIESFTLRYINAAGAAPTGRSPLDLVGLDIAEALDNGQSEHLSGLFKQALTTQSEVIDVVELDTEAGWIGTFENKIVPLTKTSLVTSFRDITDQRREENKLRWLVAHDHLTGLASRQELEAHLEMSLELAKAESMPLMFAFIDLDHFKKVNDTYGHAAGDKVLKDFGDRLTKAVDGEGFVARISGDEFAFLSTKSCDFDAAKKFVEDVHHKLQGNYEVSAGVWVELTCSAGVAFVEDFSNDASEVMRFADREMYGVKLNGRAGVRIVKI